MRYNLFLYFEDKIKKIILLIIGFFSFGIGGFMLIEDYNFLDALWMTTITLSTVGYETLHPQTDEGKIFTIVLIVTSFGVLAYAFSTIAQELIDGRFLERYKLNKMRKEIDNMAGHVVICGFGRSGRQAAKRLYNQGHDFVIVDKQLNVENLHDEFKNIHFIEGDATLDKTLELANINRAKGLIAALPKDADNLFIVLTARQMSKTVRIISRASYSTSISKLKMAGANNVIMPDQIGGEHMSAMITSPDLHEFVDLMFTDNNDGANLVELEADKHLKEYVEKPLQELDVVEKEGCRIIGVKKSNGQFIINPDRSMPLGTNMKLIILGQPHQIQQIREKYDVLC